MFCGKITHRTSCCCCLNVTQCYFHKGFLSDDFNQVQMLLCIHYASVRKLGKFSTHNELNTLFHLQHSLDGYRCICTYMIINLKRKCSSEEGHINQITRFPAPTHIRSLQRQNKSSSFYGSIFSPYLIEFLAGRLLVCTTQQKRLCSARVPQHFEFSFINF